MWKALVRRFVEDLAAINVQIIARKELICEIDYKLLVKCELRRGRFVQTATDSKIKLPTLI